MSFGLHKKRPYWHPSSCGWSEVKITFVFGEALLAVIAVETATIFRDN